MITMRNRTKYYRENELSKLGYIKKEELKDKINKIKTYEVDKKNKYKSEKIAEDYKKEILELLKWNGIGLFYLLY